MCIFFKDVNTSLAHRALPAYRALNLKIHFPIQFCFAVLQINQNYFFTYVPNWFGQIYSLLHFSKSALCLISWLFRLFVYEFSIFNNASERFFRVDMCRLKSFLVIRPHNQGIHKIANQHIIRNMRVFFENQASSDYNIKQTIFRLKSIYYLCMLGTNIHNGPQNYWHLWLCNAQKINDYWGKHKILNSRKIFVQHCAKMWSPLVKKPFTINIQVNRSKPGLRFPVPLWYTFYVRRKIYLKVFLKLPCCFPDLP